MTDQLIAMILQGGGALGAYQAGVFQQISANGFVPDWIVGTSIGAIDTSNYRAGIYNDPRVFGVMLSGSFR